MRSWMAYCTGGIAQGIDQVMQENEVDGDDGQLQSGSTKAHAIRTSNLTQ